MRTRTRPASSAARASTAAASAPGAVGNAAKRRRLPVDLDSVVAPDGRQNGRAVLGQDFCVPLAAELVQQPRRALDVREEEGDGAAWQFRHRARISRPAARDKMTQAGQAGSRSSRRGLAQLGVLGLGQERCD
jgi:hypothetical protein